MADENDFLTPDFDPSLVTVPRLRSILLQQNVSYPSTAKKPELVELFRQHVAPRTKKLRRARDKTQPTTRGIEDLSVNGDDDRDVAATIEPTPRRSTRRSSSRQLDPTPSVASSRRSSAGVSSRATTEDRSRAGTSDRESVDRKQRRRTRYSAVAPVIKEEEETEDDLPEADHDDTHFSSENPFQSGSSPIVEPTAVAGANRRRTVAAPPAKPTPKSRKSSRKTDSGFEMQSRRQKIKEPSPTPDPIEPSEIDEDEDVSDGTLSEAGEEFTPEEQDAMNMERALSGKADLLPARRKKPQRSGANPLKTAPLAIAIAALGGLALVWRQEKVKVGYCGVGRPSTDIGGVEIPDWANFLRPDCEPCPLHAYCFGDLETQCEPDFVLQHHPLSLGGVVPLPPSCEPDGEKARKVQAVVSRAVGELRDRNAQYECGTLRDENGRRVNNPELSEEDLKNKVSTKRRRGMSEQEFEDLWSGAFGELLEKDEVVNGHDGLLQRRNLRSTSLAGIPLTCALRRSVRLTLAQYLWKISGVMALLATVAYARFSITSARNSEQKAKQLASFAMDRLATRAAQHLQSPSRFPESYISMGQLRDDVLRDEFSARTRTKLWSKVQQKVENNSNVRSMVREGRMGEVSRVWEWIGATGAIDDGTPDVPSSPVAQLESSPLGRLEGSGRRGKEMKEARRWDEGRPIY